MSGREMSERMLAKGVLVKDTHGSTIRLAPPLVIEQDDLEWMVEQLGAVLDEAAEHRATGVDWPGLAARWARWRAMSSRAWSSRRTPRAGGARRASAARWSRTR